MSVIIETTIGDITVDLYTDERPRTCMNFLKLCKIKYYNLCLFHKVERNFVAQTGDPSGTGRGGDSLYSKIYGEQARFFDAETKPRIKHEKFGTLSMVNNGNNMHGSQFFLTLGENLDYLNEVHTVFGEVAEGLDVLLKLNETICDDNCRPYQDIRITHTVILDDPYDDPDSLDIPDRSPEPTKEQLVSERIGADEEIDDAKGKTLDQIEEEIKDKEAKARATILEMVGDIPDADVKPPENVLFVCKLNPVTTAEDLEIIFSRFGKIVSCEVIKDKKTGESLQYAFIEFDKEEDCENAYFKMDNVLIDDRRIHVDFSQSVAKLNKPNLVSGKEQQNAKKPSHILKENAKGHKQGNYDLVFSSEEEKSTDMQSSKNKKQSKRSHKDKKSHKKQKHSVSDSEDAYSSEDEKAKEKHHSKRQKHKKRSHKEKRNHKRQRHSNASSDSEENRLVDKKKHRTKHTR